jgi:hypothetical protein
MRPPVVAVKGTTSYRYVGVTSTNFSNYSATWIDPSAGDLLLVHAGDRAGPRVHPDARRDHLLRHPGPLRRRGAEVVAALHSRVN